MNKTVKLAKRIHGNNKVVKIYRSEGDWRYNVPATERFKRHVLRYGIIISDHQYKTVDGKWHRDRKIVCNGLLCSLDMAEGEVIMHGYGLIDKRNFDEVQEKLHEQGYKIKIDVKNILK